MCIIISSCPLVMRRRCHCDGQSEDRLHGVSGNMCLGYNDAWRADKKGRVANIWGIAGIYEGNGDLTKCWHLDRGLLVKKPGLANIWGGWQGGRLAEMGAGKGTKGRWQARGQHTSVKSIGGNESARKGTRYVPRVALFSVCIVGEVKE